MDTNGTRANIDTKRAHKKRGCKCGKEKIGTIEQKI